MIKTADILIGEAQKHIDCVDAEAARKICNENPDTLILDVRETASADQSKLEHSVNVPRGLIEMRLPKEYPDPDTPIITHCAGGGRASLAAFTLKQMGYRKVYAITAPYDAIKAAFA